MNYSENIFGKQLTDLNYADIENYFLVQKEESNIIEYKSYSAMYGNFNRNIEGVIRGICAFLNSDGGILIWGSPDGQKVEGKQEKVFVGNLSPIPDLKGKDWFISKISDSIVPLPVGINFHTIENNAAYIYIFEIQKSNYSPHQYNNTYFARLDGQTKPAPHYLIDALFKKISYPNIEGYINLDRFGDANNGNVYLDISIIIINFSALLNEEDVSYRVVCEQAKFADSFNSLNSHNYSMQGHQFTNVGNIKILHFGSHEMTSQRLIFNFDNLGDKHNYEMDLVLIFGGRKSPLKFSEYTLNFNSGPIASQNPAGLFRKFEENILASEKQKALGTTRTNLLNTILKR